MNANGINPNICRKQTKGKKIHGNLLMHTAHDCLSVDQKQN